MVRGEKGTVYSLDVTVLSAALNLATPVSDVLHVGGSFGVGPPFYLVFRQRYDGAPLELDEFLPLEALSAGLGVSARWPWLDAESGARVSYVRYTDACNEPVCSDEPAWGAQLGPYIDIKGGWKRLKLGPRVELAFDVTRDETLVLISPVTMRLTL